MKKSIIKAPLLLSFLILQINVEAAVIRLDQAGVWSGIDEVEINGSLWDATFLSGSYTTVSPTIQALTFATDAAFTLRDLFLPGGQFENSIYDTNPLLALGNDACTESVFGRCWLATPYEQGQFGNINFGGFANERGNALDHATTSAGLAPDTVPDNLIWLEWTPSTPVPIPAAIWLFMTPLAGLLGWRKYRRT